MKVDFAQRPEHPPPNVEDELTPQQWYTSTKVPPFSLLQQLSTPQLTLSISTLTLDLHYLDASSPEAAEARPTTDLSKLRAKTAGKRSAARKTPRSLVQTSTFLRFYQKYPLSRPRDARFSSTGRRKDVKDGKIVSGESRAHVTNLWIPRQLRTSCTENASLTKQRTLGFLIAAGFL